MPSAFYQPEQLQHLLSATRSVCDVTDERDGSSDYPLWLIKPKDIHSDNEWKSFCTVVESTPELQRYNPDVSGLFALWSWWGTLNKINCIKEVETKFRSLARVLLALLRVNSVSWAEKEHVVRSDLDRMIFHLQTWYPTGGKNCEKFLQYVDVMLQEVCSAECTMDALGLSLKKFNKSADKELDRATMMAKRLQATQLGHIKVDQAKRLVDDFFNENVAEFYLPEDIAIFIDTHLMSSLQYYIINEGESSDLWAYWTRIIQLLVWSLRTGKNADQIRDFYEKGPALVNTLESTEAPSNCTQEQYLLFVAGVSGAVVALLKGGVLENISLPRRETSEDATRQLRTVKSANEHQFSVGEWLQFFAEDDKELRCQFQIQVTGTDQLVFVNRYGQKVLQKSTQDMKACLDAGIARLMPNAKIFSTSLTHAIVRLEHLRSTEKQRKAIKVKAVAQQRLRKEKQASMQLQEKQERKQAQIKAEHEAKRLEQAQLEAQQLQAMKLEEEEQEHRQVEGEAVVAALTLGTWAYISLKSNEPIRCKLAVSIASTERHVFVDRVGSKVAELTKGQLIAMFVAGSVTFQEPEQHFENRLENIVRGLRRTE